MRISTALAAFACLTIGLAAPSARAVPSVVFVDCDGAAVHASARPATIVLACGDGNAQLSGLRWRGWGRPAAVGRGAAVLNDCTPSCVGGTFREYPVLVKLERIKPCRGLRQYTRLTLIYTGGPFPPGARRLADTRGCAHPATG